MQEAEKQNSKYYREAQDEYNELLKEEDPDIWDKRISRTGCYVENLALQLCHAETNDWRQCLNEMGLLRTCWERNGNRDRVKTVDR